MKPPAFMFYPADFLADENVALMTLAARGAYITLMCYCWREGSIPADVGKLGRLCGLDSSAMAQLWQELEPCFEKTAAASDRYIHPRLEFERCKQQERNAERSEAGRRGARSRWDKEAPSQEPPPGGPDEREPARHPQSTAGPRTAKGASAASDSGPQNGSKLIQPSPACASNTATLAQSYARNGRALGQPAASHSAAGAATSRPPIANDGLAVSFSPSDSPAVCGAASGPPSLTDEEHLMFLQADPAYADLDVALVYRKMAAWCAGKGKKPTRARLLDWLNREDRPMLVHASVSQEPVEPSNDLHIDASVMERIKQSYPEKEYAE